MSEATVTLVVEVVTKEASPSLFHAAPPQNETYQRAFRLPASEAADPRDREGWIREVTRLYPPGTTVYLGEIDDTDAWYDTAQYFDRFYEVAPWLYDVFGLHARYGLHSVTRAQASRLNLGMWSLG